MKTLRCAFLAFVMAATGFCFGAPLGVDAQETGVEWLDLTLSEAGTLRSQLGDKLTQIDSLVVKGPINSDDFATMSEAVYEGRLRVIDMAGADVEDLRIPDRAFFDTEFEYADYDKTKVKPGRGLRKIILPETIEEIGHQAFACEGNLESVNLPSALRQVSEGAFELCSYLIFNSQRLPQGLPKIEKKAFALCRAMGDITIPESVKEVADSAFFRTPIKSVTFEEGVETIGSWAFFCCFLGELRLPNSCVNFPGKGQFANNFFRTIKLPEVLTEIPDRFAYSGLTNTGVLEEVILPKYVERIGTDAFGAENFIKQIEFPEGLIELGETSFGACSAIENVIFPSTLSIIQKYGISSFLAPTSKAIYCKATTPPICCGAQFSSTDQKWLNIVPLFVPIGTKATYQQTDGWKEFANIIETDDFSMSGIESIQIEGSPTDNIFYDLTGHPVSTPIDGTLYLSKGRKFIFHK